MVDTKKVTPDYVNLKGERFPARGADPVRATDLQASWKEEAEETVVPLEPVSEQIRPTPAEPQGKASQPAAGGNSNKNNGERLVFSLSELSASLQSLGELANAQRQEIEKLRAEVATLSSARAADASAPLLEALARELKLRSVLSRIQARPESAVSLAQAALLAPADATALQLHQRMLLQRAAQLCLEHLSVEEAAQALLCADETLFGV